MASTFVDSSDVSARLSSPWVTSRSLSDSFSLSASFRWSALSFSFMRVSLTELVDGLLFWLLSVQRQKFLMLLLSAPKRSGRVILMICLVTFPLRQFYAVTLT